ncbi:phosphopantetheine-binding protein [Streptomyces sp. NPDC055025]
MTTAEQHTVDASQLPELIAGFYRETLGDATLDTMSDFFETGGDSLAAFQIIARLQESLHTELPVALIFTYPSPAELAEVLAADLADRAAEQV